MGCGSSSLKGDDIPNVNSQPATTTEGGQPIRKVKTNFSDINYDQDHQKRRLTEYAPHETPPTIREQSHDLSAEQNAGKDPLQQGKQNDNLASDQSGIGAGASTSFPHEGAGSGANAIDGEPDAKLKPYQTIDGGDWDQEDNANSQQNQARPYVNGTQDSSDPTSNRAKDEFASANDPANPLNQESHHAHQTGNNSEEDPAFYTPNPDGKEPEHSEHKKSWLGEKYSSFQAAKRGSGPSDEDVVKYTGKDKNELNEWAKDRPGVGGNQGGGRVGTDSGLAAGAAWS